MNKTLSEPYRWFFPLGILLLLWGALIWLPLIWVQTIYPVMAHRFLMLNGFVGCFIAGFLMTAIPRFSQTEQAKQLEVSLFSAVTLSGIFAAYGEHTTLVAILSACQPMLILAFILRRFTKRKQNPPYSFLFIFLGLLLWAFSALHLAYTGLDTFSELHYEGAIAAIIFGVGGRLIPGILGHTQIVLQQRNLYERPIPLWKTVPAAFWPVMVAFVASYFLPSWAEFVRASVALYMAFAYWKLSEFPKERSALTWSIWISSWMIVLSFVAKAFLPDGGIHISHSFFLGGIVLISLMIGTRVIQSHGPKDKNLESKKVLYWVTGLVVLAMATRVSAYYMPAHYLGHLAYSSFVLVMAVLLWGHSYLRKSFLIA